MLAPLNSGGNFPYNGVPNTSVLAPLDGGDILPSGGIPNSTETSSKVASDQGTHQNAPFTNQIPDPMEIDYGVSTRATTSAPAPLTDVSPPGALTAGFTGCPIVATSLSQSTVDQTNNLKTDLGTCNAVIGPTVLSAKALHHALHSGGLKPLAGRVPWFAKEQGCAAHATTKCFTAGEGSDCQDPKEAINATGTTILVDLRATLELLQWHNLQHLSLTTPLSGALTGNEGWIITVETETTVDSSDILAPDPVNTYHVVAYLGHSTVVTSFNLEPDSNNNHAIPSIVDSSDALAPDPSNHGTALTPDPTGQGSVADTMDLLASTATSVKSTAGFSDIVDYLAIQGVPTLIDSPIVACSNADLAYAPTSTNHENIIVAFPGNLAVVLPSNFGTHLQIEITTLISIQKRGGHLFTHNSTHFHTASQLGRVMHHCFWWQPTHLVSSSPPIPKDVPSSPDFVTPANFQNHHISCLLSNHHISYLLLACAWNPLPYVLTDPPSSRSSHSITVCLVTFHLLLLHFTAGEGSEQASHKAGEGSGVHSVSLCPLHYVGHV